MPSKIPNDLKDVGVQIARQRDASLESVATDFGISSTSLNRWMVQANINESAVVASTPNPSWAGGCWIVQQTLGLTRFWTR